MTNEDRFRRLTQVVGYTGLYLVVLGCFERLVHTHLFHRLAGPFQHRDLYYIVIMTMFFMVLLDSVPGGGHSNEKRALSSSVRWVLLFVAPVMIFLTWTRGNWLGFLSGASVFTLLGYRLLSRHWRLLAKGLPLVLLPLIIIIVLTSLPQQVVQDRILRHKTVYSRLAAWQLGIQEALKHPIFGIGLNNTRDVLGTSDSLYARARSVTTQHNSFLAIFAELGAVGLILYLAIVVSIVRIGLNLYHKGAHLHDRWKGIGVIAIMMAHLIPAFFSNILYVPAVSHVYVFTFIGGIAGLYTSQRTTREVPINGIKIYPADYFHSKNEPTTGR